MARPWADGGYRCICVDMAGKPGIRDGIEFVQADVRTYLPPLGEYAFVAAFPPCTDLANSGARWFKQKGLLGLSKALEVVDAVRRLCEWAEAPYVIENPMGTLSTYWRKADYSFDPCDYGDPYTKKTMLWTGGGFVMPPKNRVEPVGNSPIHWCPPGPDRAKIRSKTPAGFARAVYEKNAPKFKDLYRTSEAL